MGNGDWGIVQDSDDYSFSRVTLKDDFFGYIRISQSLLVALINAGGVLEAAFKVQK
jgi:hypothetical protein